MRVRRVVALVVVLASLVLPAVAASPADAAAPRLDVWPRADIVDDEPLLISVRNWPGDNTWLAVSLCKASRSGRRHRCDYVTSLTPGAAGNIRVRRPADVVADLPFGPVDCRIEDCVLQVLDPNGEYEPHSPILRLPLHFDPAGPDPVRPAMTVSPDDDLTDGDVVTVTGHALPLWGGSPPAPEGGGPARPFSIYQCPVPAVSHRFCDQRSVGGGLTPAGDFTKSFTVRSRLFLRNGATVDCLAEDCTIVASANGESSEAGLVPLAFDPGGPVPPAPTVTATPAADLQDGQVVTLTGEHFEPRTGVNLYQCPPGATGYGWRSCHEFFDLRQTDAQGEFTFTWSVHATFDRHQRPPVDCRTVTCEFVVTTGDFVDEAPAFPITFDPETPLVHQQLTASPTTGLVSGNDITVEGEDYYLTDMTRVAQCVVMRNRPDVFPCAEDDQLVIIDPRATSFTTELRVQRRILTDGGWVNCAVRYCYVNSGDSENGMVRGPRLVFDP